MQEVIDLFKHIYNILISPPNNVDYLGIASINGTILSIFIGSFSAYLLFIYGNIEEIKNNIFYKINKINNFEFIDTFGLPKFKEELYSCTNKEKREELINGLYANLGIVDYNEETKETSINDKNGEFRILEYKNYRIKASEKIGKEILKIFLALLNFYPFPTNIKIINKNGVAILEEPIRINFNDVEEVKDWRNDFKFFLRKVKIVINLQYNFYPHLKAYNEHFKEINKTNNLNNKDIITRFKENIVKINKIKNISESVGDKLVQLENYKKRIPSKWKLISSVFIVCIAFISGVILPMVSSELPRIVIFGFPIVSYILYLAIFIQFTIKVK